jgi:hypothetical protein
MLIDQLRVFLETERTEAEKLRTDATVMPISGPIHPMQLANLRRIRSEADGGRCVVIDVCAITNTCAEELKGVRRRLLREILCFFPCNPVSETHCKLVNITLPNDSRVWVRLQADVVAAALGHAARLLDTGAVCFGIAVSYLSSCVCVRVVTACA